MYYLVSLLFMIQCPTKYSSFKQIDTMIDIVKCLGSKIVHVCHNKDSRKFANFGCQGGMNPIELVMKFYKMHTNAVRNEMYKTVNS
jgi:hypothetical protein